jgi:hypothetical protein
MDSAMPRLLIDTTATFAQTPSIPASSTTTSQLSNFSLLDQLLIGQTQEQMFVLSSPSFFDRLYCCNDGMIAWLMSVLSLTQQSIGFCIGHQIERARRPSARQAVRQSDFSIPICSCTHFQQITMSFVVHQSQSSIDSNTDPSLLLICRLFIFVPYCDFSERRFR